MLEIREIDEEDAEVISQLEKRLFSDAWSLSSLQNFLASPFAIGYMASEEGVPVAYLLGNVAFEEGELLRIGTKPAFQKRGIGKSLLSRFCRDAEKQGVERIFLEVREGNLTARTLYEKTGFLLSGRRKSYYSDPREDALLYQMNLNKE